MKKFTLFSKDKSPGLLITLYQQHSERMSDMCIDSFGSSPVAGLFTAEPGFITIVIITQKSVSSTARLCLRNTQITENTEKQTVLRDGLMSNGALSNLV